MRGEASEFVDYLDTLPTGFPTMPILDDKPPWLQGTTAPEEGFIADEPWLYHGTGVEKLAQAGPPLSGVEGVSRMGRLIDELDPQGLHWHKAQRGNDSALRWAAAAVQSRAHSSRNSGTALVPLADSFNHSPSHANVELIELDSSFQIRALRKVKPDEELFLSYGNFSSAELLFNGGFACQANQHNCIIITRAELVAAAGKRWQARGLAPPTDIDLEARCTCLAEMGLPGPHGPRLRLAAPLLGGAVPAGLVSLVCGLLLSSRAWRRHVLGEREGERPTCEKDVEGNKGDFGAEGGDGGPGALHDLWAMASFLGAESADTCPQDSSSSEVDGEVLRHEVLLTLTELLVTLRHVRYGNSSEADAAMLRSAEQAQEHAEAAGKYAEAIASQRRVNILRVRVGELAVLTQLEATVRARSAAFSAKQLLATSPDAASSAPRSLAVSPAKRQRVDDVAEMA
ncbi:unnamed protein product [Polarella glacialis]|nr:unnamed protein product [Polarella glacialis]